MNYKLIIFSDSKIVLINDEPDIRDIFPYHVVEILTTKEPMLWQIDNLHDIDIKNQKKIIAGLDGLPKLTFTNKVERILKDKYNWVDVEELSYNWLYDNEENFPKDYPLKPMEYGYQQGFKDNQRLTNKRFTIKDMRYIFDRAEWDGVGKSSTTRDNIFENIIDELSKPVVLNVQIELVEYYNRLDHDDMNLSTSIEPKIENNKIRVIDILN